MYMNGQIIHTASMNLQRFPGEVEGQIARVAELMTYQNSGVETANEMVEVGAMSIRQVEIYVLELAYELSSLVVLQVPQHCPPQRQTVWRENAHDFSTSFST